MKICIQTLKGVKHDLDVEESDTIRQVKEKIDQVHHLGPAATQKLIYVGKILNNEQTVGEIKIKPGDFLVVMAGKGAAAKRKGEGDEKADAAKAEASNNTVTIHNSPPPATAAPTTQAQPTATAAAAATEKPASPPAAAATTTTATTATAAATTQASGTTAAASNLVVGENLEGIVADLMNLGFPHDRVMQALRASYNNPDRAAEYLLNGMPAELGAAAAGGPEQQEAGGDEGDMDPDQLANMAGIGGPELDQLRQLVQANPQIIPALLQQIAQSNPELYQALDANPQAFMRLLGPAAAAAAAQGMGGGGQGGGIGAGPQGAGGPLNRPATITITQEEKRSIDALEALGFPRQRAVEAFLICDKNEQLAANYLFDHMHEWQGGGD